MLNFLQHLAKFTQEQLKKDKERGLDNGTGAKEIRNLAKCMGSITDEQILDNKEMFLSSLEHTIFGFMTIHLGSGGTPKGLMGRLETILKESKNERNKVY